MFISLGFSLPVEGLVYPARQGLHALDDMVVTCAHALAARAVIPDPFAEHYDILPHAPCGACSATPFPGAAALLTLPSGACFFKPRGMAARDAGIPHAPEPSVRVPCSRSQKAPSLPAGPSGNDRAVWQAPERKSRPAPPSGTGRPPRRGQRPGNPWDQGPSAFVTIPARPASGAARAAIPDSRPAGRAARPGPGPASHRPGCRYAAGRGRSARGTGRSRPRAA